MLKTNEKIENCDELVIPDDMVQFITNHTVDDGKCKSVVAAVKPKIKLDLDEIEPMSSSISIEKIKEEDLFTLLTDVDVKSSDDQDDAQNDEAKDMEINNNNSNNSNNVNGQDECKIESDTSTAHQQISCKS